MTTVAWDGQTLASDSMATLGDDTVSFNREKIRQVEGVGVVGFAGKMNLFRHFCEWLKNGKPNDTKIDFSEFDAIVIWSDSYDIYTGDMFPETINRMQKNAIGSGSQWAMAAMDLGKSAGEAVEYACTRDIYSALPVEALSVKVSHGSRKMGL